MLLNFAFTLIVGALLLMLVWAISWRLARTRTARAWVRVR